jgi:hypothetical protein
MPKIIAASLTAALLTTTAATATTMYGYEMEETVLLCPVGEVVTPDGQHLNSFKSMNSVGVLIAYYAKRAGADLPPEYTMTKISKMITDGGCIKVPSSTPLYDAKPLDEHFMTVSIKAGGKPAWLTYSSHLHTK